MADEAGDVPGAVRALRLRIDGPASVLAESTRYGLQLACFFRPSALTRGAWTRRSNGKATCGICVPARPLAWCPLPQLQCLLEEIRLFHEHFRRTVADYASRGDAVLHGGAQEMVFPDLSFSRRTAPYAT